MWARVLVIVAASICACSDGGGGPEFPPGPPPGPNSPGVDSDDDIGPACRSASGCGFPKLCVEIGVMSPSGYCAKPCDSDGDCTLRGSGTGICGVDVDGNGVPDHCQGRCTSGGDCPAGWQCTANRVCRPAY